MIARVVTLVLGIALALMARWDPPGSDVYWHDLVIGLVIAFLSVAGMFMRGATVLLTALGLWLFFSGMVFPIVPHIYVGLVAGTLVFVFSLISSSDRTFWPFGSREPAKT
ncbi:MAG TPA: hypothetical protein VGG91_09720 [Myxococcaceae bacterium]|jgi:hypothetical protein